MGYFLVVEQRVSLSYKVNYMGTRHTATLVLNWAFENEIQTSGLTL
jgi:hypothetical protein